MQTLKGLKGLKEWLQRRKPTKKEIVVFIIALIFCLVFLYGYTSPKIVDAAVSDTGEQIAVLTFWEGMCLSVYQYDGTLLFQKTEDDVFRVSGGHAYVDFCDDLILVETKRDDLLFTFNLQGELLSVTDVLEESNRDQWDQGWQKHHGKYELVSNSKTYVYQINNYFARRFGNRKPELICQTQDAKYSIYSD